MKGKALPLLCHAQKNFLEASDLAYGLQFGEMIPLICLINFVERDWTDPEHRM